MPSILENIKIFAAQFISEGLPDIKNFAHALNWTSNGATIEDFPTVNTNLPAKVTRAFINGQKAAIFAGLPDVINLETLNHSSTICLPFDH